MAQPRKRLGEILIDAGVIDEFQLKSALSDQKRWGDKLGSTLVKLGMVTEEIMAKALSSQLKIPNVNLRTTEVPAEVYNLIPGEKAKKLGVFPVMVKKEGAKKVLYVAMSDPTNLGSADEIQFLTGHTVKPVIAMDSQIQGAIDRYYFGRMEALDAGGGGGAGTDAGAPPKIDSVPMRLAREAAEKPEKMQVQRGGADLYGPYGGESEKGGKAAPAAAPEDGRPRPSKEMLALLRLLSRKGIITKEEFIEEFKNL
ncbi:MAG: hypothetical protein AB1405_01580 [Bdellovibrionota bacterium]